ncbi:MAG: HlyD family efflux transporter periplasmic adaptor subunit, partial [Planctomycetota bacterium]
MDDINLDDLKIDHKNREQKRGFPWGIMVFIFLLGSLCGIGLIYFQPSWIPGLVVQDAEGRTESAQPIEAPQTIRDGAEKSREPEELESFTEGGWIEVPSYHPVLVSALIPGRLEELRVLEGSAVKKGEVIALLYAKDLMDALTQAEAEVKVAEADLARLTAGFRVQEKEKARADLKAAEADLNLKWEILQRTQMLVDTGAESVETLDRDRADCLMAEARKDTLLQELRLKEEGYRKEDIAAARAGLEQKLALCELARNRYEYTFIKSPVDGVVLERFVTEGTYIPANTPRIVSLYDPNDLQVRVDVRQEYIGGVFLDQPVKVFTEAEPNRAYAGTVIRIEPK